MKALQDFFKSTGQIYWTNELKASPTPGWDSKTVLQSLTCFQWCLTGTWRAFCRPVSPHLFSVPTAHPTAATTTQNWTHFFIPSQEATWQLHSNSSMFEAQSLWPAGRKRFISSCTTCLYMLLLQVQSSHGINSSWLFAAIAKEDVKIREATLSKVSAFQYSQACFRQTRKHNSYKADKIISISLC